MKRNNLLWCLLLAFGFLFKSSSSEEFKCPEQFGYYPDLQDCSKYYVCVFGDSLHEKCTGGLFFSIELQTCDWPRNVECATGETPDEPPTVDFDSDDEVFSSSRRTSATSAGARPKSPNTEISSNYQSVDKKKDEYSRNRPQESSRSRSTSPVTSRPGAVTKPSQITTVVPSNKQNAVTVPDQPPTPNEPATIPEDPLYLSDERSKISDPLGNYDPQQPDFDEAAPPLIDSDGGIHVADGGHGLDAFAGLAHLPGLGDYSVLAKPIYNAANSGSSEHLPSDDHDYNRKQSPNSRIQPLATKPRSLESFQSNNGRSKDPDVVIDYSNGNKNLPWNSANGQKEFGTPPPTIFDDNAGHRDYGGFDVITPLKTNIQSDHEPGVEKLKLNENKNSQSNPYSQPKHANPVSGSYIPIRDVNRLNNDNRTRTSFDTFDDSKEKSPVLSSDTNREMSGSIESEELHEEFPRLNRNNYGEQNRHNFGSLLVYEDSKDDNDRRSRNRDKNLDAFLNGKQYAENQDRSFFSAEDQGINVRQRENFDNQRTSVNINRNPAESPIRHQNAKTEEQLAFRRQPDVNSKDSSENLGEPLNSDFGIYTGSQRQNRKLDTDSVNLANQNIDESKGIIPAESIQPSVRQPNQIQNDNSHEKNRKNEEKHFQSPDHSYRDEYDELPPAYGEYDSPNPHDTDDYYTNQGDQETTPRSAAIPKARPTRPRRPITTTTTTTTTTTPAPIRVRSRKPISPSTSPTKSPGPYATTGASPPYRPAALFPTPLPYTPAQKCDPRKCRNPDCRCGGTDIPGDHTPSETPQIVILTFDDAVNDLNNDLYDELFNSGRTNPNGCPILGTFYVSHEWTDYGHVQTLYSQGHEIASHSITHSYGEKFSKNQWVREIHGQREILHLYGGVKMEDIRGMRAPFLQIGGNKMFEMLYDANFTYDSSMPVYENNPPFWPYTLDYALNHECMIFPCPTKSYPGLWEIGMVMWVDLRGGRCSMGDACSNPPDEEAVSKMLMKNFNRHYNSNKAPFGLFYHSAWFNTQHHRRGFMKFLDEILKNDDVYLVTNWQLIQWMRDPTPLSKLKNFEPFNCRRLQRPPPCPTPTVCNVWYQGGVRYMKTCQPCPAKYPWIGNTGYDAKNRG